MASRTQMPVQTETMKAAGAITAHRLVIGPVTGATQSGANGEALGVAQADAATGEYFPVVTSGVALVEASEAITDNTPVSAAASGKLKTWATGQPLVGRTRAAASGNGVLVPVDLFKTAPATE